MAIEGLVIGGVVKNGVILPEANDNASSARPTGSWVSRIGGPPGH